MSLGRAARPRKPDSGRTGTTSTTFRVRLARWNAMKLPVRSSAAKARFHCVRRAAGAGT